MRSKYCRRCVRVCSFMAGACRQMRLLGHARVRHTFVGRPQHIKRPGPRILTEPRSPGSHTGLRDLRSLTRSHRRNYAEAPSRARKSYRVASAGGSYSGKASYYWQGQQTASGARFNPNGMTAAHRTLPFGTRVRVTNHSNGRSVVVTINDRGPFIGGRIIDLSRGAAQAISMTGAGVASVSLEILGRS